MKQNNYILNVVKVTFCSLLVMATSPIRAEIKVVTTIKPLHSLIANVMDGVGEPSLIIEGVRTIAVINSLFMSDNIEATTRKFINLLNIDEKS